MYPNMYGQQSYQQNLQNIINDAQNKLNMIQSQQRQTQPTNLTQNFQLAPSTQSSGVKYVNSIDDVKSEFVINDSVFLNKELNTMWLKQTSGDIKTYSLKEVIELDEKDLKISELEQMINDLRGELENAKSNNTNDDESATSKKSTSFSNDKSSKK